jgi:hypothetical protein
MGGWSFSLYPDAAEGGGSFRSAATSALAQGPSLDPLDSSEDAARRAKRMVRRYCAANRLNRLGTLTYRGEGQHSPGALRSDVGAFFRRLRRTVGDEPFPYLWVPEWHKSGHGLHVHFAVGRFIGVRAIERAWGHGFVHIKLLGDLPIGSGSLGEARQAARYLSKYVGKAFGSTQTAGRHRYEVGEGFQPRRVRLDGATADEVLGWAETVMGKPPSYLWRSRDQEGWEGPPSVFASWE